MKRRRESIIAGAASSGVPSLLDDDDIVLSEKHMQEIEFNKEKLNETDDAFTSGSRLLNETDDAVRTAVHESKKKNEKANNAGNMKTRAVRSSSMRGRCALMS